MASIFRSTLYLCWLISIYFKNIMKNLNNNLHLALRGLEKMRCQNNNPIFFFNVSQDSFPNIPASLCHVQECLSCGQHYKKIKQDLNNKNISQYSKEQTKFVLAQSFVLQIVNKIRPLTTNQEENIKNSIKCFDQIIKLIELEKEKLRTIAQYNGLSFQQSVFLQNVKKDQQKLITIDLLHKINKKLNKLTKCNYEQMFEALDKKIFKEIESQLNNFYCKHTEIELHSHLKRAQKDQDRQMKKQECQRKYLQYFGRPPQSPKNFKQAEESICAYKKQLNYLFPNLAIIESETYFNNYGDDYDYDYLSDGN